MADEEEILINGKELQELRVVDLKKECDKRGLAKGGSKVQIIERLKAQLLLEKLQQMPVDEAEQAPNLKLQDGDQNEFIKQYLERQRQLIESQRESIHSSSQESEHSETDDSQDSKVNQRGDNSSDKKVPPSEPIEDSNNQPKATVEVTPEKDQGETEEDSGQHLKPPGSESAQKEPEEPSPSTEGMTRRRSRISRMEDEPSEEKPAEIPTRATRRSRRSRGSEAEAEQAPKKLEEPKEEASIKGAEESKDEEVKPASDKENDEKERTSVKEETKTNGRVKEMEKSSPAKQSTTSDAKPESEPIAPVQNVEKAEESKAKEKETKAERRISTEKDPSKVAVSRQPDSSTNQVESRTVAEEKMDTTADTNTNTEKTATVKKSTEKVKAQTPDSAQEKNKVEEKAQPPRGREEPQRSRGRSRSSSSSSGSSSSSSSEGSRSRSPPQQRKKAKQEKSPVQQDVMKKEGKAGPSRSSSSSSSRGSPSPKRTGKGRTRSSSSSSSSSRSRSRSHSRSRSKTPPARAKLTRLTSPPAPPKEARKEEAMDTEQPKKPEINNSSVDVAEPSVTKPVLSSDVPPSEKEEGEISQEPTPQPRLSRKISRTVVSQEGEQQPEGSESKESQSTDTSGDKPARKRKWGSKNSSSSLSQKASRKASSLPISTDSLKGLIPDMKSSLRLAEPVLEMDFEDDDAQSVEEDDSKRDVKISRTVVQEVNDHPESPTEDTDEDEEVGRMPDSPEKDREIVEVKKEVKKTPPKAEPKIIRRINQSMSIVEPDEPETAKRSPSPARNPVSKILHIRNLVRPFTLTQLKELLKRTGSLVEGTFWIDKIKSHCYATFELDDEAVATRNALHNTRWPQSNPKTLFVDFAAADEITYHKEKELPTQPLVKKEKVIKKDKREQLLKEKEKKVKENKEDVKPVREWDRDKVQNMREWDRDKVRSRSRSPRNRGRQMSRSLSGGRDRMGQDRSRERLDRKERKGEKKEDEAPAKLLDDLFRKTKATPCIYWLPLTEIQSVERQKRLVNEQKQREADRIKRHSLDGVSVNPRNTEAGGRGPRGARNPPPLERSPVRGKVDRMDRMDRMDRVEDRGRRKDNRSRSRSRRRR